MLRQIRSVAVLLAGATLALTSVALADEGLAWPRFRGPDGSGVAEGQSPPVEFGPERNVVWKVAVPSGLSSPIVAGDLLVLTAFDDGQLYTIAYRRADGSEAWRKAAPAKQIEQFFKMGGSPAASTPVTDGRRIVTYFGSCGLVCYDLAGKELWRYELPTAKTGGNFGSGVSPILAGGLAILVRDVTKDPKIIAVNLADGKLKWEQPRASYTSFCTPIVWETPAGLQVVSAGHARLSGYDLRQGAEKWFVGCVPAACCASPVTAGGTLYFAGWSPGGADEPEFQMPTFDVLLMGDTDKDGALSREEVAKTEMKDFFDAHDANGDDKITKDEWDLLLKSMSEGESSALALKPGGSGDVTRSHILWKQRKGVGQVASAILYRGQLVMVKDGGIVTAYDARSGDQVYQQRVAAPGSYYASPVAANGHIYLVALESGTVTVLKAGAEEPEVVATNPELGERVGATPAIADHRIYLRTDQHLYAFGEAGGGPSK